MRAGIGFEGHLDGPAVDLQELALDAPRASLRPAKKFFKDTHEKPTPRRTRVAPPRPSSHQFSLRRSGFRPPFRVRQTHRPIQLEAPAEETYKSNLRSCDSF